MISATTIAATRFGYGLPAPKGSAGSTAEILALLAGPDLIAATFPIAGQAQHLPLLAQLRGLKHAAGTEAEKQVQKEQLTVQLGEMGIQAQKLTFARAVDSLDGFRERLVAFWADHFSVVARNFTEIPMPFALVEDAIRPNLAGNFADLVTAVTLHPAMLLYLDQVSSVGPNSALGRKRSKGLNENLARELIELHTLGVGAGYSQVDVTQMAKLLTGVTYNAENGMFFEEKRAEPGAETVLGTQYDGEGLAPVRAALRDLASRPETARHIARKLVVHFITDTPDEQLIGTIARAFQDADGDLMAVYGALLSAPAAWGETMLKVRQPYDFLVAASRALGITGANFGPMDAKRFRVAYPETMAQMGQRFKHPDGPNGFPEAAEEWVTPMGLARRISWAMLQPRRLLDKLPDPVVMLQACLAERASPMLVLAAERAEDEMQGVGLILASAEFNRR